MCSRVVFLRNAQRWHPYEGSCIPMPTILWSEEPRWNSSHWVLTRWHVEGWLWEGQKEDLQDVFFPQKGIHKVLIDVITNYEIRSKMRANQLSLVVNPTYDRFLYPFACSCGFLNFEPCLLHVGLRCKGMYDYIRKIPEKSLVFSPMMPSSPREFWGFDGMHEMYLSWHESV